MKKTKKTKTKMKKITKEMKEIAKKLFSYPHFVLGSTTYFPRGIQIVCGQPECWPTEKAWELEDVELRNGIFEDPVSKVQEAKCEWGWDYNWSQEQIAPAPYKGKIKVRRFTNLRNGGTMRDMGAMHFLIEHSGSEGIDITKNIVSMGEYWEEYRRLREKSDAVSGYSFDTSTKVKYSKYLECQKISGAHYSLDEKPFERRALGAKEDEKITKVDGKFMGTVEGRYGKVVSNGFLLPTDGPWHYICHTFSGISVLFLTSNAL